MPSRTTQSGRAATGLATATVSRIVAGMAGVGRWLGIDGPTDLFVLRVSDHELIRVASVTIPGDDAGSDPLRSWWKALVPPTFSADSRAILFQGTRTDGRTVTRVEDPSSMPRSGPLFFGDRPRDGDIHVAALGSTGEDVLIGGPTNDLGARLAPDGATLAFVRSSARSTGAAFEQASDLYVRSLASGEERLVASDVWPVTAWSASGRSLLARSADGRELVVVGISGSAEAVRIPIQAGVGGYSWQALRP